MMSINGRIRDIQIRIKSIQERFLHAKKNANTNYSRSFSDTIADIQERIYADNFSENSKVVNLSKYDNIIKKGI